MLTDCVTKHHKGIVTSLKASVTTEHRRALYKWERCNLALG